MTLKMADLHLLQKMGTLKTIFCVSAISHEKVIYQFLISVKLTANEREIRLTAAHLITRLLSLCVFLFLSLRLYVWAPLSVYFSFAGLVALGPLSLQPCLGEAKECIAPSCSEHWRLVRGWGRPSLSTDRESGLRESTFLVMKGNGSRKRWGP